LGSGVEAFPPATRCSLWRIILYARAFCVVKAAVLAKVPKGLDFDPGGGATAGDDDRQPTLSATGIKAGQTVMVIGAVGSVGRSAAFTAKERGATVIAGV